MNPVVIKSYLVPEGTLREGGFRLEVEPVANLFKEAEERTPDEMGNFLRTVALSVGHWSAYLIPWRSSENSKETARTNAKTENDELQRLLREKEEELKTLRTDYNNLCTSNEELQRLLHEKEEDSQTLKMDYNDLHTRNGELQGQLRAKEKDLETLRIDYKDLRTRLSEMGAMQLTEGNPNITDLSDQNRPDKIAEQFSELYDNQWTDCYMVLMDRLTKSEQETVDTLLTILKTVYDISLNRSQEIMSDARKVLVAFAGKSDGESEKALDSLIQETLHKMKSYRTKHFKAVPIDIAKEINEKLVETIGEQGVIACGEYIEACARICWLMCIKDPPMYIFCEKEDVFNKNHFMEYTEKGHKVSYVVWPVLYLYKNGPLMRKGVAQGEGKQIEDSKVAATEDGSPKSNEFVENNSQFNTETSEMVQPNGDDHAETEFSANNEHHLESMQIRMSLNTLEDISVQEHGSEQQDGTRDINATVAEGNSSTGPSNKGEGMHLREAVDSGDVKIQFRDDVRSQTENDTFDESSLQVVIEGLGNENSKEGNAAYVAEEEQSEQSEHTANGIKSLKMRNNGREESIQQNQETQNQAQLYHTLGNIVSKDREDDRSCGDKEAEDKIAVKDQAEEQVKSPNTDVTNAIRLCNTEAQDSPTSSTEEGAERQVDESGKQEDVGIHMQLLALTGHKAGARQHIPDNHCVIEEHERNGIKENQEGETELTDADESQTVEDEENRDGDRHVESVLMGVNIPVNVAPSEEHEHELSNPCGMNSNNSSNNHLDDSTLEVGQKHIVQTSIATSEKTQEDNSAKTHDAVMSIHGYEMELGKKTNDIVLLENETRIVDNARDMDAPHSLDESCEETEECIVSPSKDKDRPEVNVKEKNLGVADVCSLSENNVPGENDADDNNLNVAVATADGVANPTVELQKENHHQGKISEDSSVEGH